jgi:hypothetical protein
VNTSTSLPLIAQLMHSSSIHLPAYPLPTSYPTLIRNGTRLHSTAAHSSLSTGTRTAETFRAYATFVEDAVKRKVDAGSVEMDELRELSADLWTIHDGYVDDGGEDGLDSGEDGMDE